MRRLLLALLLFSSFSVLSVQAAWLDNVPQTVRQPDGSDLHCFATGDEFNNWLHDGAGYTIVQDPSTGYYVYALLNKGELVPSAYVAGQTDPAAVGIAPHLNIAPERMQQKRAATLSMVGDPSNPQTSVAPRKGSFNNLCIFIRFSGESEFTDLQSKYTAMFNNETAGANSMRLFFYEASYNQLLIMTYVYPSGGAGATVVSYQDSHPRSYYQPYNATTNPGGYNTSNNDKVNREHALLKAAVDFIAPLVPNPAEFDADNDGRVDNVCFIVSGSPTGWNSLLWPHRWSLYSVTAYIGTKRVYDYNLQLQASVNTGVLCHEMSHTVGFPDLYHYTSNNMNPVAAWDLMAANRNPPQHMGAYQKMKYGAWISSIPSITASGIYTLQPLTSSANNAYKIPSPNSATEFFVVEYRKRLGIFESSVPGEGLLVYRINTAASGNANGPPDEIYYYRPGGTLTTDGDYSRANFSSTVGRRVINDTTAPSAFLSTGDPGGLNISEVGVPGSTISFKVAIGGGSTITFKTNPAGLSVIVDGTSHVTPHAAIWEAWSSHMISTTSPQEIGNGARYLFTGWDDGGSQSRLVTGPTANKTFTASFRTQYMLTMMAEGGGTASPASGWHDPGESVAISATPASGSAFRSWTGAGVGSYTGPANAVNITMTSPITQVANFTALGTAVEPGAGGIPAVTALSQNYPNPFNPVTRIKYTVGGTGGSGLGTRNTGAGGEGTREQGSGASNVNLRVYDVLGREVAVLVNERKAPGSYEVSFDASGLASGVYIYRLTAGLPAGQAGSFTQAKQMLVVK